MIYISAGVADAIPEGYFDSIYDGFDPLEAEFLDLLFGEDELNEFALAVDEFE